ncbi:radical SAM protein [archaeon]|nr:radical SAM protein [archaeon]
MKTDPYKDIAKNSEGSPCLFTEVDGTRITWEATGRCDLGCAHCSVDAVNDSKVIDLKIKEAKNVIDQFSDNNVTSVYVSGGEPLIWKPLYETLRYAHERGIFTSLATNGKHLDEANAAQLRDANVGKVLVSIDSHVPELHDQLRSKGSYDSAANAVRMLSDDDVFVRIGHVIWKESIDNIEEFAHYMKDIGADEIAYNWLLPTGRAKNNPDIAVPLQRYNETGKRLKKLKEDLENDIVISYHRFSPINHLYDCMGGKKFFQITSNGRVAPCSWVEKFMPQYVGSKTLRDESLQNLMNSNEVSEFKTMIEKRNKEFGPGCPVMCYVFNNTPFSRDPLYEGF